MFLSILMTVLTCVLALGCGRIEKTGETLNADFAAQFPENLGAREDEP